MAKSEIKITYLINSPSSPDSLRSSENPSVHEGEKLQGAIAVTFENGIADINTLKAVVFTDDVTKVVDTSRQTKTSTENLGLNIQAVEDTLKELTSNGVIPEVDLETMRAEMIRREVIKAITPPQTKRRWFGHH